MHRAASIVETQENNMEGRKGGIFDLVLIMTPTSKYKKLFTDLATPLILIFVDNLRNENQGINKVHRVTVDSNSF